MFRIDRNNVNLGATKSNWVDIKGTEAGAVGDSHAAAASAEYTAHMQAQEIIAAAEVQASEKAEQILRQARDEVADILHKAIEDAEEAQRKAFQEGYAEGAVEGKRSYDEQLGNKIREDDEMVKSVITELYDERERTYAGLEEQVVGMSLEIVRKIIAPAEDELGGVFQALIKNALRQISPEGKVIIHVSPAEYDRFFSTGKTVITLESGTVINASVLRDTSLAGGDCIIDTEQETINAGINSQLKYIALAFEKMIM